MNNTASEHSMVERLILDDLVHWAVNYKVIVVVAVAVVVVVVVYIFTRAYLFPL